MGEETDLSVLDIALAVAAAIESSGGEYFVGGSVASSLQGEPFPTHSLLRRARRVETDSR